MKKTELSKAAYMDCLACSEEDRNFALVNIAEQLLSREQEILEANLKDMESARSNNLNASLLDRLELSPKRIKEMSNSVLEISKQEQVIGKEISSFTDSKGLTISKERVALGVIAMIFESRPNVVIDSAALAIKSGNAILLKGGKEAKLSNKVLSEVVRDSISDTLNKNLVTNIDDRAEILEIIQDTKNVALAVPRGGQALINYVYENAKVPVIAHFQGLCHIYVDAEANPNIVTDILINAKAQRPGVCNSMETLIFHREYPKQHLLEALQALESVGIELRVDPSLALINSRWALAEERDWASEYLDKLLSVRVADSIDEAISHIQNYGTNHTEAILTENKASYEQFKDRIDASCIMWNASTRFNDGGCLGLGAELGISTTKIHAYGPMGAKEMTTERFLVIGQGQIRT
ncbi:MAG: glutamate-5-semialdehyde dehydrogenase [Bdellovibrionales bacterium]